MNTEQDTKIDSVLLTERDIQASKGYWTDDTNGFVDIAVLEENVIALSSCHWYRVQFFQILDAASECWTYVKTLLRECGRTLPPTENGIYRLTNLSSQQANQIYYLLKHNLTSLKIDFRLHYGLTIDETKTVKYVPKPKRRRLRNKKNKLNTIVEGSE